MGLAEKTPSELMSHIVRQVESISMRVQKELVLLHKEGVLHPTGTVKWLNALGWLSSYFHVSFSFCCGVHEGVILVFYRCAVLSLISHLKSL